MLSFQNKLSNEKGFIELGNRLFIIGVFFLPSALPISLLFLLVGLVISFYQNKLSILKDKFNYSLLISIGIIFFSTLNVALINKPLALFELDNFLIWINLLNWIPIFFIFWGFQIYLKTNRQRLVFAKALLSGTFPVLISILSHKFLNIYGPFETLFGSIVWFMKPLDGLNHPVAGLFSNPNYASMWLILALPFFIFFVYLKSSSRPKKILSLFLCLTLIYCALLTGSRNAIIGIIISLIFVFGFRTIIFGVFTFVFVLLNKYLDNFVFDLSFLTNNLFIPESLISKFQDFNFFTGARFDIWRTALMRIQERPFLGWGGGTFSFLHERDISLSESVYNIVDIQHSHNLPIELAHNFGIPLSILLTLTVMTLIFKTSFILYKKSIYEEINLLDRFWIASVVIILINHLTDITFYDGKISIILALLLSGLKCIFDYNSKYKLRKRMMN